MTVYDILQVKPDATDEEIKAKYKELARKYHPDKNDGDDTKMVELNEAYKMIDTPEKRHDYDTKNAFSAEFDMLSTVFGRPTVAENFKNAPKKDERMANGTDINLKVKIPIDVFLGGAETMPIKFKRTCECLECDGTGGNHEHACPTCGGYGYVVMNGEKKDCPKCHGAKKVKADPCKVCNGTGLVTKTINKVIRYAPGVLKTTIPNAGNSGRFGGANGNLNVTFVPKSSEIAEFDKATKSVKVSIDVYPEDFVLGVTKLLTVGSWSSYITLTASDMESLPIKKKVGSCNLLISVKVQKSADDVKKAQEWRNSRINDII